MTRMPQTFAVILTAKRLVRFISKYDQEGVAELLVAAILR